MWLALWVSLLVSGPEGLPIVLVVLLVTFLVPLFFIFILVAQVESVATLLACASILILDLLGLVLVEAILVVGVNVSCAKAKHVSECVRVTYLQRASCLFG